MSCARETTDRLTTLPEDLHSHILSLMPTKYAVRTSILSKRWRHTWMLINNIDFHDKAVYSSNRHLPKIVNQVLKLCKTSQVNKFRLHYLCRRIPAATLSKWITKAVSLNVCELDIKVLNTDLRSMYTCSTLTKLRVHFNRTDNAFWGCPSSVNLPCLKTLEIVVGCHGQLANVFKFIYGCPILENLSLDIIKCCWRKGDYNFKIPTLKRLDLKMSPYKCPTSKFFCNVPNLEYISVEGYMCSIFKMDDISSLVEVRISGDECELHLLAALLKGVCGAKYLSLRINLRWFHDDQPLPKFANLKRLELKGYNGLEWLPLFLESCSKLEHLCIERDVIDCWNETRYIPTCLLKNLKTLRYTEHRCYRFDMKFLKFIIGNSKVLQSLTVKCDTNLSLKEKECIIMLPRASSDCEIRFDES